MRSTNNNNQYMKCYDAHEDRFSIEIAATDRIALPKPQNMSLTNPYLLLNLQRLINSLSPA
jgi:hypothetical protein